VPVGIHLEDIGKVHTRTPKLLDFGIVHKKHLRAFIPQSDLDRSFASFLNVDRIVAPRGELYYPSRHASKLGCAASGSSR
jgi:hypothetical protein